MKTTQFRLSVLLVTYNHEKHIGQALSALFRQIIDGPIELVVADDGSSDRTMEIIRGCEAAEPRFHFRYLDNSVNLGITRNYKRGFAACHGDYVAVLEGDDYWVSPSKLQRQRDFLDYHWESDLCSVNYFVYEEDRAQFTPRAPIGFGHRFVGARDLIADNLVGNFSTCMYRKSALSALPEELYELRSYDWIVNICVARKSLIGFIEEPLSVYRLHASGVWTQTLPVEKLRTQLDLIPAYDKLTAYVYHADFEALASRLRQVISSVQLQNAVESAVKPMVKALPGFLDHVPAVVLSMARVVIPKKIRTFMVRMLMRSAQ